MRFRLGFVKTVFVFFAILFAAILIHPEWDLADVPDVKIPNLRASSTTLSPVQPNPPTQQVARLQRHRDSSSSSTLLPMVGQSAFLPELSASVRVLRI